MPIIISILTTLLPSLLKIVLHIIDKKYDNDTLENYLTFLIESEKDLPIELHAKYDQKIEEIRNKLRKD
jgi:hypothetical protein